MTKSTIMEQTDKYVMQTYNRYPVALVGGKGVKVWDDTGREYLDLGAGIAVNALGHAPAEVVSAIQQQASELMHASNLYYLPKQGACAAWLVEHSGLDRVFFCNSGTEAVEAAIKLARKTAADRGRGSTILSAKGSFHGRTFGSLAATGQAKYQQGFEPLPAGFVHLPLNDLEALESQLDDQLAAVLLEPIQGEGGIHPCQLEYLQQVQRLCQESGALLVLDEVQTGIGRTGHWFAFQHYGLEPDIISLAKGLGGGFPIGAMLAKEEVARSFTPGTHASTFGGNPLACAAALATLESLERRHILAHVRSMEKMVHNQLEPLLERGLVTEIRGRGLMVGLELPLPIAAQVVDEALAKGLLVLTAGAEVVRLVPPLVISAGELYQGLAVLSQVIEDVAGGTQVAAS